MDFTGLGSIADFAKGVVDRFFPPQASAEEKLKAATTIQQMIQERENVVVNAKASIMVAEMNQDDNYTKRGRPTLLYAGLVFIFIVHVLIPLLSWLAVFLGKPTTLPTFTLPPEFWWAWSGVCGLYVIGRTSEKQGGASGGMLGKAMELLGGKK